MSKRNREDKENATIKSRFFSITSYFKPANNTDKRIKPASDQQIENNIELSVSNEEELKPEQCPVCQAKIYTASMSMEVHVNLCLDTQQNEETKAIASSSSLDWRKRFSNVKSKDINLQTTSEVQTDSCSKKSIPLQKENSSSIPVSSWKEVFSSTSTVKYEVNTSKSAATIAKKCPFYKRVEDTRFTVDAFSYGKINDCDGYFLSHFHADHYGGLRSKWSHGPIYCSKVTANLIKQELRVNSHYIRALPLNEVCTVSERDKTVQVVLIDANHCPGSVLFLFIVKNEDGSIKRHLHTGDFRAAPRMCLHPLIRQPENASIDCLYLDTTYLNPQYSFPAQEECIQAICDIVKTELDGTTTTGPKTEQKKMSLLDKWIIPKAEKKEKHMMEENNVHPLLMQRKSKRARVLIVVGTYTIGKERVFINIAKMLNCKIYANAKKKRILTCQEDPELNSMLTDDPIQAQIHVVPLNTIKGESMNNYLQTYAQYFDSLIAFKPTGWSFKTTQSPDKNTSTSIVPLSDIIVPPSNRTLILAPYYKNKKIKLFAVPYSEHSSFRELACFIASLDIKRVIPTVNVSQHQTMSLYFKQWASEKKDAMVQRISIEHPNENHW